MGGLNTQGQDQLQSVSAEMGRCEVQEGEPRVKRFLVPFNENRAKDVRPTYTIPCAAYQGANNQVWNGYRSQEEGIIIVPTNQVLFGEASNNLVDKLDGELDGNLHATLAPNLYLSHNPLQSEWNCLPVDSSSFSD